MPLNFPGRSPAVSVIVPAVLVAVAYTLALYFQAATASLSNAYQAGIELLRSVVSPGGLLMAVFLVACLRKSYAASRVAMLASAGAVLVSALMLALVVGHQGNSNTWQFPEARSLSGTLHQALCRPSFSNRSVASVAGSGVLALLVLGGSAYLSRRRQNNPLNPDTRQEPRAG